MAKRIKGKDTPLVMPIANWDEAADMVKRIGQLQMKINACESKALDDINEAKAALANASKPLLEKIKLNSQSLEAFAVNHRSDIGKAQSKDLDYGTIGWRKSTKMSVKKNTIELLKKIFGRGYKKYVTIKEVENKDALKRLTDGQLASVGARRKTKEAFYVEPDLPEAIDYEDQKSVRN